MVVSLPYSIPQPMKSLPFYILQLSLKNKPLSSGISLKGHYSECSGILPYDHLLIRPPCYYDYVFSIKIYISLSHFIIFKTLLMRPPCYTSTSILWPNSGRINGAPLYPHPPKLLLLFSWSFFSVLTLIII